MVKIHPISLSECLDVTKGTLVKGEYKEAVTFTEVAEPAEVSQAGLAFIISENYLKAVPNTKAMLLVVQAALMDKVLKCLPTTVHFCISCEDAYLSFANFSKCVAKKNLSMDWVEDWVETEIKSQPALHPTAKIGKGSVVLPGAVVGPMVEIGEDCLIFPGVVLYPRTKIGNRVRLHANVVVGCDGFGYARSPQGAVKIWHLGGVVIGDDVEIGANTVIDRGTLKDTVIEKGAKLDNLIQIGHNGYIKSHAILCAQIGLAGNVTVGSGAILAGQVGVADKVEIGDGALVGGQSGVTKDIPAGSEVTSVIPIRSRREWWRIQVLLDKLPELYDRIKKLEKRNIL